MNLSIIYQMWSQSGWFRRDPPAVSLVWLVCCLAAAGCSAKKEVAESEPPQVTENSIKLGANSPQLAALTLEPVGARQPEAVRLAGRLTWDDDVTVRVFTPFAGIARTLGYDEP